MGDRLASYGFRTTLDLPYTEAVEATEAALKAEGFGVLSRIDVRATLAEKIGADWRDYVILGACNPHLAHRALSSELELGLLLPCNVIVYDDGDGGSTVAIIDPEMMLSVAENPALEPIAVEAAEKLRRVVGALES